LELDGCLLLQVLHARVELDFLLVNVLVESPLVIVFEVGVRHPLVLRLLLLDVVLCLLHAMEELFKLLVLPLFL
jgi:hypothetical protein